MNNNMTIRQGSQMDFEVRQGDSAANTVTLIMRNQETLATFSSTATYVNGIALLTLDADQTSVIGVYDYQLNENISGEDPVIYPANCADGNCDFPTITVCEALAV